jgi:4-hydroxybenzoate polyprenyltransferase
MNNSVQIVRILRMIRFEHSVFALPFALCGAFIAAKGWPPLFDLLLIIAAAVSARSGAMSYNRIRDRFHDASNPRTKDRELAKGTMSLRFAIFFTLISLLLFILFSYMLSPLCGLLSLPCIIVLLGYSHLKNYTFLCHLGIGLSLAIAPAAAWLAVHKTFLGNWESPLWIGAGVLCWVSGFDILYALQDIDHDKKEGTFSLPARFGESFSLKVVTVLFVLALVAWQVGLTQSLDMRWSYAFLLVIGILLSFSVFSVHRFGIVSSSENLFRINTWVPILFIIGFVLDFFKII